MLDRRRLNSFWLAAITVVGLAAFSPSSASADPCQGGSGSIGCGVDGGDADPGSPGNGGGGENPGSDQPPADINCPELDANFECITDGTGGTTPDVPTVAIANSARDQLALPRPTIHTSPSPRTYVGLSTNFWIDAAGFTSRSLTVTIPGQAVTATATPQRISWDLGEQTIVCSRAGSERDSKCSYTYQRSSHSEKSGAYTISATTIWEVTWVCAGSDCDDPTGTLPEMTINASTQLGVGEIQTNTDSN